MNEWIIRAIEHSPVWNIETRAHWCGISPLKTVWFNPATMIVGNGDGHIAA